MQASTIPAMTTDAERECYYRLAMEAAPKGTIIELGAWLGASTAYIAAGIRDSGVESKALVFDKFETKGGHIRKVREFYEKRNIDKAAEGPSLDAFRKNLGGLMKFVEPRHPSVLKIGVFVGLPFEYEIDCSCEFAGRILLRTAERIALLLFYLGVASQLHG